MIATAARHERLATIALLASGLLWGLTWIPLKHFAAQHMTGLTFTVCTYGAIGAVSAPWIWLRRRHWQRQAPLLALIGLLGGLANACFVTAMMFGEISRAMLLFYLTPLWGAIGGYLFFHEALTRKRLACVAMALSGAVLVLGGPTTLSGGLRWIDLVAIASGFFYAGQNIAARAAVSIPVSIKVLAAFVGCGVVALALMPVAGHEFPPIDGALASQLAAFAVFWLVAAMWAQIYGVSHMAAGRAAVLVVFELVAAVVSAMVIAGERLSTLGWLGAALIIGAALVESRATPLSTKENSA
ncbi:MAG: DMT family transporter [Betaproteobacteria bacterium]